MAGDRSAELATRVTTKAEGLPCRLLGSSRLTARPPVALRSQATARPTTPTGGPETCPASHLPRGAQRPQQEGAVPRNGLRS